MRSDLRAASDRVKRSEENHIYVNYRAYVGWRHWHDAVEHGYVSACGHRHLQALRHLKPGHLIWVYAPRNGYVGVARVKADAEAASMFKVQTPTGEVSILEIIKDREMAAHYQTEDLDECEYYVSVHWLQIRSLNKAIYAKLPLFSSRLVVCQPNTPAWRDTVVLLKQKFPAWNS